MINARVADAPRTVPHTNLQTAY